MKNASSLAALLAAAIVAVSAGTALAIDVQKRITVEGGAADVWAKVGGWCAIKDWHPAVAKCEELPTGAIRRVLTLKDGGQIKEMQTASKGTSYSYVIEESPLPVKNYSATFSVAPAGEKNYVDVAWTAKFEANGKPDDEAKSVIEGIFDDGMKGIAKLTAK